MFRRRGIASLRRAGFTRGGHSLGVWRRPTATRKANKALRILRKMQADEEVKHIEAMTETMQIPIAGNWITSGLGPYLQQGDTETTRDGNKITLKSIALRITIQLAAIEATGCSVRLVLVQDRRPNGAQHTAANVMAADNCIHSSYTQNSNYRGRFQIWYDKTFAFGTNQLFKNIKLFIKPNAKCLYEANGGTVADMTRNNFTLMAMADNNAAAIDVNFGKKLSFVDL